MQKRLHEKVVKRIVHVLYLSLALVRNLRKAMHDFIIKGGGSEVAMMVG